MIEPTLTRPPAMAWAAPLVLLVVAVGPWPYGFYMVLRLAVFCAAVFLAYTSLAKGSPRPTIGWVFIGLALLYNPFFRGCQISEIVETINGFKQRIADEGELLDAEFAEVVQNS